MGFVTGAHRISTSSASVTSSPTSSSAYPKAPYTFASTMTGDGSRFRWARSSSSKMTHCRLPAAAPRTRRWRWRDWGYEWAWPVSRPRSNWARHAQCDARRGRRHEPHTRRFAESHRSKNFVLTLGAERTILVRHADFNYKWKGFRDYEVQPGCTSTPSAPTRWTYQDELADWLDSFPNVRLAFQPRHLPVGGGTKRLARLYARAELLLCSRAAANIITGTSSSDSKHLLDDLLKLGSQQRCGVRRKRWSHCRARLRTTTNRCLRRRLSPN